METVARSDNQMVPNGICEMFVRSDGRAGQEQGRTGASLAYLIIDPAIGAISDRLKIELQHATRLTMRRFLHANDFRRLRGRSDIAKHCKDLYGGPGGSPFSIRLVAANHNWNSCEKSIFFSHDFRGC